MAESLVYGGIDLTALLRYDGLDYGAPESVTQAIAGVLVDGEIVSGSRSSNRMIKIPLQITGATATALAASEAALAREVNRVRNTLTWNPNGGLPVAFDTFRGQLRADFDLRYYAHLTRQYVLEIPALPFARTPELVSLASVTTAPTTIDAMDNVTGVTGSGTITSDTATFTQGTASIKQEYGIAGVSTPTTVNVTVSRTITSLDISTATSVQASRLMSPSIGSSSVTLGSAGGTSTYAGTRTSMNPAGWYEFSFQLSTPTSTTGSGVNLAAVTSWTLTSTFTTTSTVDTSVTLRWDSLRAYVGPYSSVNSKGAGVITFPNFIGSARAPIGLTVDAGAVASSLLVATCPNRPDAFSPLLNATTNVDADALSGFNESSGSTAFTVPSFAYRGQFALLARMKSTTGETNVEVTVNLSSSGGVPAGNSDAIVRVIPSLLTTYGIFALGVITLPFPDVDPSNTAHRTQIKLSAVSNMRVDQLYILPLDGDVVRWQDSTYSPRYFWLDSPSLSNPRGGLFGSTTNTRSNAYTLQKSMLSGSSLRADPGSMKVLFVAVGGTASTTVTATYYPSWFAGREA